MLIIKDFPDSNGKFTEGLEKVLNTHQKSLYSPPASGITRPHTIRNYSCSVLLESNLEKNTTSFSISCFSSKLKKQNKTTNPSNSSISDQFQRLKFFRTCSTQICQLNFGKSGARMLLKIYESAF